MKNTNLLNEEINQIRKMMGLKEEWGNDDYVDDNDKKSEVDCFNMNVLQSD